MTEDMRSQEQVIDEIHRQREELVSAMAETRRDVAWEIDHLKQIAKRGLPIVAAVAGILVGALTARKLSRVRENTPVLIERLRVGRFSLLERV